MSLVINSSTNTVTVTSQEKTVAVISHENTSLTISEIGTQGIKGDTGTSEWGVITGDISNQADLQAALDSKLDYDQDYIIYLAEKSTIKDGGFNYTSGKLTGIAYDNTVKITTNSKTLIYTGELLTSIVHVFTYESQIWTITTTYTYTGSLLTGKPVISVVIT